MARKAIRVDSVATVTAIVMAAGALIAALYPVLSDRVKARRRRNEAAGEIVLRSYDSLNNALRSEINRLEQQIRGMRAEHDREVAEMRAEHDRQMSELRTEYDRQLAEARQRAAELDGEVGALRRLLRTGGTEK